MDSNNSLTFYDDVEQEYNLDILRSNIKGKMKEKNIKQTDLVRGTKIPQPTMSRLIGKNPDGNFQIQYLVKIAQFLDTPVDDLLGLRPKDKPNEEITLSDIFEKLFGLDSLKDIRIEKIPTALIGKNVPCVMYFSNKVINTYLMQWMELKKTKLDPEIQGQIIDLWKKGLLEKGKSIPIKSGVTESNEEK